MKPHFLAVALVSFVLSAAGAVPFAQAPGPRPDTVDLAAIQLIKDEGLQRSQVMDTAWNLTEVYGPRLTNSPAVRAAAEWAARRLTRLGPRQRPPGNLGTVRPRLGEREVHRHCGRAAAVPADCGSPRVDAWHERPRDGRRRRPEHPHRPGHGRVERQARRQGRAARGAGGSAPALHAARPAVHRSGAGRPADPAGERRPRPRRRGGRPGQRRFQPALHAVPRTRKARWPPSSRPRAATTTAPSW